MEDAHSAIDRFVEDQLHTFQVKQVEIFIKDGQMFEIRSRELLRCLPVIDQSHVNSVSDVLHRLSEYRIVHQLKEILFNSSMLRQGSYPVQTTGQIKPFLI